MLSTVLGGSAVTWLVFRATSLLSARLRIRDAGHQPARYRPRRPVDPARDHIRGAGRAVVTIVEYGDFECPWARVMDPGGPAGSRRNGDPSPG
jgi:hypothetical protein